MRAALALCLTLMLAGCANYTLVEPGTHSIAGRYSVQTSGAWSKLKEGNAEVWTVDGRKLESLVLTLGTEDGDSILKTPLGADDYPAFRSDMSPSDIADLVADTVARTGGASVRTLGLRPAPFGSHSGFRFELEYLTAQGLEVSGAVAGAVLDGRLYALIYTGVRVHYYDTYRPRVEALISSIRAD